MQLRKKIGKYIDKIRKYGPGYSDFPTVIQNVTNLLRLLTLNIDSRNKKPIPIFFYILTVTAAAAYAYVFAISATWFILNRCLATGDVIRAIIMFSLSISSEIGNSKFFYIYIYRDIVRKIVSQSLESYAGIAPGSRYSRNVLRFMRRAKVRAIAFWVVIMGNGVVYVAKSILTPGRHFMEDVFTIYGLEPIEKSPNYEIGYTLIIASVWFLCYVPANVTALLIIIAGFIEAQMLALTQELLHIWPDAESHYKKHKYSIQNRENFIDANYKQQILNAYANNKLHDIIKKHANNVHLLQLLEEVFKGAIALEFMLLILGLIAELLGGLKNTYLEIPYAFVQVAMDCWTGQRLIDASSAFAAAVYASNWERFDVTNMKTVLMMLGSSQKTMKLSAGGVATLSGACLMSVVKSIYSAYTTLQTTLK
uniref:Odorant receptor n=1 Tax=Glyphodes pyloalis TaxID=1242752 RepID=A0A6M3GRW8_GLYPY|nr:olfactory receptor [Glyphodes pyloalis]